MGVLELTMLLFLKPKCVLIALLVIPRKSARVAPICYWLSRLAGNFSMQRDGTPFPSMKNLEKFLLILSERLIHDPDRDQKGVINFDH